ncbi:MAG: GIY-YIG nuclease family protein [Ignavibacteria bacterium]|nr:GIY-YIG nuclease family protein [Ignavibacteria bacterium]
MCGQPLEKLPSPDVSAKRIYAYRLNLTELAGRVKVGETERSVHSRVKEQVNTAGLADVVQILMDEPAVTADGRTFRDVDVHAALKLMEGVTHKRDGGGVEWFDCSIEQVKSAYNSVYMGCPLPGFATSHSVLEMNKHVLLKWRMPTFLPP